MVAICSDLYLYCSNVEELRATKVVGKMTTNYYRLKGMLETVDIICTMFEQYDLLAGEIETEYNDDIKEILDSKLNRFDKLVDIKLIYHAGGTTTLRLERL